MNQLFFFYSIKPLQFRQLAVKYLKTQKMLFSINVFTHLKAIFLTQKCGLLKKPSCYHKLERGKALTNTINEKWIIFFLLELNLKKNILFNKEPSMWNHKYRYWWCATEGGGSTATSLRVNDWQDISLNIRPSSRTSEQSLIAVKCCWNFLEPPLSAFFHQSRVL